MSGSLQDQAYQVRVLLAVWGEHFIDDFLQLSLPSLLAPGNMPALAAGHDTRFVFLTRLQDVPVFERNPAFQLLKTICPIEFLSIEDLIVQGGYSATLTLAFDRAVRATGAQMLNTYFVFLTADYLMADGSMQGLMRYIQKGYSGICAGNFQVVQDEMVPFLEAQIKDHVLAVKPRELLKQSFRCLHPITMASFFDENLIHNYRANRFFYRNSQDAISGRFYLLHMLCIKPETQSYRVGASCDYSFIPEMCPSGNVAVITDSDDYLVVEAQERSHELGFVNWGKYDINKLTQALSEWTTVQHRQNAEHTIYFHVTDIDDNEKAQHETVLNKFTNSLARGLRKIKPKPYYNHPYWSGALDTLTQQRELLKNSEDHDFLNLIVPCGSLQKRMFHRLFGSPPYVFPWHFHWREHYLTTRLLKSHLQSVNANKVAVFYDTYLRIFMQYCDWFKQKLHLPNHFTVRKLQQNPVKIAELQAEKFEVCVLMVALGEAEKIKSYLDLLKTMLTETGKILVFIPSGEMPQEVLKEKFLSKLSAIEANYQIIQVDSVHNDLSVVAKMTIDYINTAFTYSRKKRFFYYLILGVPGCLFATFRNIYFLFAKPKNIYCTSFLVALRPAKGGVDASN
jgi:hypothetical protein